VIFPAPIAGLSAADIPIFSKRTIHIFMRSFLKALCLCSLLAAPFGALAQERAYDPGLPPHSICTPDVEIFTPSRIVDTYPAGHVLSQAALFLERVPERELRAATRDLAPGEILHARSWFEGPDTRWRLPPVIRERATPHSMHTPGDMHTQYLIATGRTRPHGTLAVTGYAAGSRRIFDPLIVAHLADGRAIAVEASRNRMGCTVSLDGIEGLFLDALAAHLALRE